MDTDVKKIVGKGEIGIYNYFIRKFPELILVLYQTKEFKSCKIF